MKRLPHVYLGRVAERAGVDTDWLIAELLDWPNPKQRVIRAALDELDHLLEEHDQMRAALVELVTLKEMKDALNSREVRIRAISGEGYTNEEMRLLRSYAKRKTRAWQAAREALKGKGS